MESSNTTLSPFESETITIMVGSGDEARKFYIHKDVVCEASPFFRGCLDSKNFPEGRTNSISLPEDDPEAFILVLAHMYHLEDRTYEDDLPTEETFFLAYVLADKLCIEEASMSLMRSLMEFLPTTVDSDLLKDALPRIISKFPDCAATNFLIAQVAWEFAREGYWWYCSCNIIKDGETCAWCEFFKKGGPMVVRLMKALKGTGDKGTEPRKRGAEYWINQAREQQSE